jgi:hypothetical protein
MIDTPETKDFIIPHKWFLFLHFANVDAPNRFLLLKFICVYVLCGTK